jgi:hypothetical protein
MKSRRTGWPITAEHQNRIIRSRRKPPFPTVATSKTPRMKIRKARPRAIRMALRIFISGDKFPTGGKTYIENYPAIGKARSEIELAVR